MLNVGCFTSVVRISACTLSIYICTNPPHKNGKRVTALNLLQLVWWVWGWKHSTQSTNQALGPKGQNSELLDWPFNRKGKSAWTISTIFVCSKCLHICLKSVNVFTICNYLAWCAFLLTNHDLPISIIQLSVEWSNFALNKNLVSRRAPLTVQNCRLTADLWLFAWQEHSYQNGPIASFLSAGC